MRQLYTSPRPENIERVVALMDQHGIATSVTNRSNYKRPGYQRFSYSAPSSERDGWPQVWIERADDYTRARSLIRELGIEPVIRHAEALAASRGELSPEQRRRSVTLRVRRIVLLAVAAAFVMVVLGYMRIL